MKRILMILQSEFPPDIRLEKEIKSLSKAGYSIHVVCNQYEKKLNQTYKYCTIGRVKALFKSKSLNKIFNFPVFFNPRIVIIILLNILKYKPDFIHAHDLPMAPLGLFFGRIFRIPVISDMHENYPGALKAFQKKGLFNFIFKNYKAAKILEKYCIKKATRVLTVIEENSERLISLGVSPEKIFKVSNTVEVSSFAIEKIDDRIVKKYEDKFILIYFGFVTPERGLDTVVLGMKFLKEKLPSVKLLIIGNGISIPFLKKIVDENLLQDIVEFIEWPGHENLSSYLEIADICISPQPNNELWNTSIPHKLFEYMSKSKPVLTSDAVPLKRIVLETGAGLFYKSNDPENFSEKVIEMVQSKVEFGKNGLSAVTSKYNWENDANVLIDMYDNLFHEISTSNQL